MCLAQHNHATFLVISFLLVLDFCLLKVNYLFYSRKHFTEEQAAKWWSEKGAKVCEELNARSSEQNVVGSPAFPGKKYASYHGFP